MNEELLANLEALLFAVGRKISVDELATLCQSRKDVVAKVLKQLQSQYQARNSPLVVLEEGNSWHLTVREKHLPLVQRINPHTELSKTLLETLAVVSWKQPITQSEVIRVRGGQAYEHLAVIEEMGFLTRQKHGRTFLLKLTKKFYDYFDLPGHEALKKSFQNIRTTGEEQKTVGDYKNSSVGKLQVYETNTPVAEGKSTEQNLEIYPTEEAPTVQEESSQEQTEVLPLKRQEQQLEKVSSEPKVPSPALPKRKMKRQQSTNAGPEPATGNDIDTLLDRHEGT
ncbi:SMC-Scp complex subunit ScpB [Candidatus Woesearchaeota archaeon]|nr:SMC-Scp complex subunit ScpB [Candidatus Woesearchaeota archaeon]